MAVTVITKQQFWIAYSAAQRSQPRQEARLRRAGRSTCDPTNSDGPTDLVRDTDLRTQFEHRAMFASRFTCGEVPSADRDEAFVQQPSS